MSFRNYEALLPANLLQRVVTEHVWPTGYIGNMLCPRVLLGRAAGKILKADVNQFAVDMPKYKAGSGVLFDTYEGTYQDISTSDRRIGVSVTSDEIDAAEEQGIPAQTYIKGETLMKLEAARLAEEAAIMAYFGNEANWASGNKESPTTKWDAASGQTPITELIDAVDGQVIHPNLVIFAKNAFNAVRQCSEFIDLIKYTKTPTYVQALTEIQGMLGVDTVAVWGWGSLTDQYKSAPGKALAKILDEVVIIAYVPPSLQGDVRFAAQVKEPVFAVNPTRHLNPTMDEAPWYDKATKEWLATFMNSYNPTEINEDLGHLIYNVLT